MWKDNFPNQCAWEEPAWIKSMRGYEFEKKSKRDQERENVDLYEDTKRGIYSEALPWINKMDDQWLSKIYLEQVNLNLMASSDFFKLFVQHRSGR